MPLYYASLLTTKNVFSQAQTGGTAIGTITGAVTINLGALGSSSGITWSQQPASANNFELTATGNVTALTVTNGTDGAVYNILLVAAGFTWPTSVTNADFGAPGLPTLSITTGKRNLISGYWYGASSILRASGNAG